MIRQSYASAQRVKGCYRSVEPPEITILETVNLDRRQWSIRILDCTGHSCAF